MRRLVSGPPSRSPGLALGVTLLLVVVAAVAVAGLRDRWAAGRLPDAGLRWIWDRGDGVRAVWAVRDFRLREVPSGATLLVQADPEYRIFLNGFWVAAGRYLPGAWHGYEVAAWLYPSGNRLAVELRSPDLEGGLLLCLRLAGEDGCRVVSDGRWRVFSRHRWGILEGWRPAEAGEPARVWGRPPVGRWPLPRRTVRRPVVAGCLEGGRVPARIRPAPSPIARRSGRPAPTWELSWEPPVAGYLELPVPDGEVAIMEWESPESPAPGLTPGSGVVAMRGAERFTTAEPRRWRRVRLVGPAAAGDAAVLTLAPACSELLAEPATRPEGLLGLRWPPLRTPVEDKLRRQL